MLADGDPGTAAAAAKRADVTEQEAKARMKAWPGVFRDDQGRVTGFWGLSLVQAATAPSTPKRTRSG